METYSEEKECQMQRLKDGKRLACARRKERSAQLRRSETVKGKRSGYKEIQGQIIQDFRGNNRKYRFRSCDGKLSRDLKQGVDVILLATVCGDWFQGAIGQYFCLKKTKLICLQSLTLRTI